jgi:hypothetical protein
MARILFVVIVTALLFTAGHANQVSGKRDDVLRYCNVTAQQRSSGKYDLKSYQRVVYAACMFSHSQSE